MGNRNAKYWKERQEYLQKQLMAIGEEYYRKLSRQFDIAQRGVQTEIDSFYQRFADDNQISFADAQKFLTSLEREAYQMSLEEYLEKARTLNYSQEWARELENASTLYRVSRLQMLQTQMRQSVEELYAKYDAGMGQTAAKIYENGYYRQIFELQKGLGFGVDFTILDGQRIQAVAAEPWTPDGKNFSERIWGERTKLVNYLNTDFAHSIIRGASPRDIARDVQRRFGVSKRNAEALALTESAFFSSQATKDGYAEMGVERYDFLATLNERTCETCGALDGMVFEREHYQPGVNADPMHVRCRCTTVPHFDDLEEFGGGRWAKNGSGKAHTVPGDMTYGEWKKKFASGVADAELTGGKASGKVGDTDGYTTIDAVRKVDFRDNVAVQREIETFRETHKTAPVEHSIVISPSGNVYELTGTAGSVNPEIVGAEELKGSVGAHNHPVWEGYDRADSFSRDDLLFSARYKTGMEYLVSGNRRDAFLYTGNLSEDELYWAYEEALNKLRRTAAIGEVSIDFNEQELIMRILSKDLEGFAFYGNS